MQIKKNLIFTETGCSPVWQLIAEHKINLLIEQVNNLIIIVLELG
jgi:hypothetical protein